MDEFRILSAGDLSLIVEFGEEISIEANHKVNQLNRVLKDRKIKGVVETIPTYRSLLIYYDPYLISFSKLCGHIKRCVKTRKEVSSSQQRIIELPVCYGGEYGEDLVDVAKYANLTQEEVIKLHTSVDYLIYMLGFLPGFPYLGGLDERLHTPRLPNPRTLIPAGSVGIGGEQTGVYPMNSPGGWKLIGRTPIRLYDSTRENPTLYKSGDRIRFRSITKEEYMDIEYQVNQGTYQYRTV